jgi:uncharacterized lipoprotein YmbA
MRALYKVQWLMIGVLLVACRSDPVHYHTLTPLLSAAPRNVQPGTELQIERVTVPPQVDRSQVVLRQGTHELVILETDWWGASLADELESALINQFSATGNPGSSGNGGKATLRLDVQRFDLVPGQYALLDVKWRIRSGPTGVKTGNELTCQNRFQTPAASPAIEGLVMAQQENLRQLASVISGVSRSGARRCP